MIDFLEKYLDAKADYIDIRAIDSSANTVHIRNEKVDNINSGSNYAFSFRVLVNGAWGFSSTNKKENLDKTFDYALRLAKLASKRNLEST